MEEKMGVGKGGSFKGGVEFSMLHSLVQSAEVRHPAPVFFVTIPRIKSMPRIVKGHRLFGTRWTFPLLPEESSDEFQMVTAKGTIGLGRDYDIYLGKQKIGRVDHQRAQKDIEIQIYDEFCAKDKVFVMLLTLFGCVCNFMKETEEMVARYSKAMKDTGTAEGFKAPKPEMDLFKNPRMLRK